MGSIHCELIRDGILLFFLVSLYEWLFGVEAKVSCIDQDILSKLVGEKIRTLFHPVELWGAKDLLLGVAFLWC